MLFQSKVVLPSPAGEVDSKSVLLLPHPWSITIVGNGPVPVAGSVTSASSGTLSKEGTRCARVSVGQKRTPFCALHACPNGIGSAAAKPGAPSSPQAIADVLPSICTTRRILTTILPHPL